jgi:hypothetical protein
MGTNRRYAAAVDKQMDKRVNESIMRGKEPVTLSDKELELDVEPLTRAPTPRPVVAWVRYGEIPIQVEAHAVAWTAYAVAIRWAAADGVSHRAWVWAAAVRGP